MNSRRTLKAAEAIREVVGMAILVDLKDPRIRDVTVTFVEVSPDMRMARVHVSVMGDEKKQTLSLAGLQNSSGFLQKKIGDRLDTRYTPRLSFVLDQGVKNAMRVNEILSQVLPRETTVGVLEDADPLDEEFARPARDGAGDPDSDSDSDSDSESDPDDSEE